MQQAPSKLSVRLTPSLHEEFDYHGYLVEGLRGAEPTIRNIAHDILEHLPWAPGGEDLCLESELMALGRRLWVREGSRLCPKVRDISSDIMHLYSAQGRWGFFSDLEEKSAPVKTDSNEVVFEFCNPLLTELERCLANYPCDFGLEEGEFDPEGVFLELCNAVSYIVLGYESAEALYGEHSQFMLLSTVDAINESIRAYRYLAQELTYTGGYIELHIDISRAIVEREVVEPESVYE